MIAILTVILMPFKWLLNDLSNYQSDTKELLHSSAQVAVIEKNLCDLLCLPIGCIVIGEVMDYQGYISIESSIELSDEDRAKTQQYITKIAIVGLQKPLIII